MLETAAQHELDVHQLQLAEAVYAETNGNPFFIEEVIRHLVETKRLYREGGRWITDATQVEDLGSRKGCAGGLEHRPRLLQRDPPSAIRS